MVIYEKKSDTVKYPHPPAHWLGGGQTRAQRCTTTSRIHGAELATTFRKSRYHLHVMKSRLTSPEDGGANLGRTSGRNGTRKNEISAQKKQMGQLGGTCEENKGKI